MNGAIAQLGERLVCIQKVCGSIPHGSTNSFKKVSIKTDTYLHLTIPKPLIFGSLFGRIDFLVRNCGELHYEVKRAKRAYQSQRC